MIQSIEIITSLERCKVLYDENHSYKKAIDLSLFNFTDFNSFDVEITFKEAITEFRNQDYTWKKDGEYSIANEFSPKIIKLESGQIVQSNITAGIWEVDPKKRTILLWRFNPDFATPISNYLENENKKVLSAAKPNFLQYQNRNDL